MTEAQAVDLAQDENNTTTTEDATSEAQTDSSELSVSPRFYINHSSSGGGFDGFTGVEGFIPLDQTPGRNVTYFNGRVNLDNDANFGSNVIFGHRSYSPEDRTIYGGYAAWDVRNTGSETFHQLGVGVEGLGETWDWRINGYLPIGETRQGEGSNGSQITGVNFQNNTLLLDVVDFSNFQSALGGLEAEVGAKIAEFDNGGDLRAFGGVYFLDGEGTDGTIGGRFRAEVRPLESLSLGAGVQFDDIFGTNLLFQVRFGLPLQVARSSDEPQTPELLYSRLADPIVRNNAIIIDQQVVNDSQANVVAVDPTTGTAYTILHVDPTTGAVANAGTFEAPVDSIANAVPLAASGDIVYVLAGNAGGGFTIPDGVQILSVAPVQTITTQFGDTQLPGSGSGSRPVIDSSSIELGNNTTLSGFEITNAPGDAVSGNNISNVTIQNNLINAALGAGINLENVGGIVLIENNQLENSVFDTGIFITTSGAVTQQLTIVGNTISGNAEQAILLRATGNAQVTATVQDNTMTGNNTAVSGIEIEANNTAPGSLCLDLNGNNSDTNYLLTLFPDGQFQVVNQADLSVNNTGTVSQTDISTSTNFVSVNVCP
ncbi:right-handed parallel beta-helix repeat-containing protein [Leptothoe kymatousa]|uniref:Right-handed parallel beta-helix repeat-containing protein n=1 Tax=Leptothoe kymatousa TAU-MAC 1615 TaxID=2364775 RepID=A0ABS5Y4U7_9CYAN|nr:right-handed parallel beta-helix repeat-containing protein [Leptothoe kymatousa]MBT9312859.1 right-handed parallel beta-helix repeat-containing protein [Leptothoe kymatousa TAU-MAC 1615]